MSKSSQTCRFYTLLPLTNSFIVYSLLHAVYLADVCVFSDWPNREAQEFVEKFEGALGKGRGRKLYAFKIMMAKVICSFLVTLIATATLLVYRAHDADMDFVPHRNLSSLNVTLRTSKQPAYPGRERLRK